MKEELKRILNPYYSQLEDEDRNLNRITMAQQECIRRNRFNGCWNCKVGDERCTVKETRAMTEGRIKLIHLRIAQKVKDWLNDV